MKTAGSLLNRKTWIRITAAFYILAGFNHFVSPEFYLPLIPPYFSNAEVINSLSGVLEIAGGIGLLVSGVRRYAAWGIGLLLLAFIPSHVYFIQIGSCIDAEGSLCVPEWVGYIRLMIIHPILLWWSWKISKY